ncbi:hypothetical protein C8Q77DRAFT_1147364 [Trametes polyzona]|nr:hypothetical protein C8Q77DRAFT_1147364 [Trametes polyzona]
MILSMREEYAVALSEELEGRVEFSRRFYGFPDEPHARRIDTLKGKIVENDNALDRLRAHRNNFLVEEQLELVETGERECGFAEQRDAEDELLEQILSLFWRHGGLRSGAWGVLELSDIPV